MTPWRPGDPTATGLIYFDSSKDRMAYYAQDTADRMRGLARHLMSLPRHKAQETAAMLARRNGNEFVDRLRLFAKEIQSKAI